MSRKTFKLNEFHPQESITTLLIEERYRRLGVIPGWTPRRVEKVARWLCCTVHELGRMAGMELAEVDKAIQARRFPPSASLQFAMVESFFVARMENSTEKPAVALDILISGQENIYGQPPRPKEARHHPRTPSPDLRAPADEQAGPESAGSGAGGV